MKEHFIDCEGKVKKTNYKPWNGKGLGECLDGIMKY